MITQHKSKQRCVIEKHAPATGSAPTEITQKKHCMKRPARIKVRTCRLNCSGLSGGHRCGREKPYPARVAAVAVVVVVVVVVVIVVVVVVVVRSR